MIKIILGQRRGVLSGIKMINKHKRQSALLLSLVLLLTSSIMACAEPTPSSPLITAGPASFDFSARQGGANPARQTLSLWNSGGATLTWSATDSADCLILSPTSGSSAEETDNIILSVDISGMNAGSYAAVVTISAPGAANTPQTVVVNLTINPPAEGEEGKVEEEGRVEEEVIDALDTERLLDIGYNHPEKVVTVEGVIVRTYYAKKSGGKPTFLDFHDPYEEYFICIIWEEDRQSFVEAFPPNPESYFLDKKVRVEGTIDIYEGAPEIVLRDPSQIWVVE
jgi:hypothetical protein